MNQLTLEFKQPSWADRIAAALEMPEADAHRKVRAYVMSQAIADNHHLNQLTNVGYFWTADDVDKATSELMEGLRVVA